jgi:hypothetical protein
MENYRVRMKVGVHEFEADGPKEEIDALFSQWREMIRGSAGELPLNHRLEDVRSLAPPAPPDSGDVSVDDLAHVYAVDDRRDLVALRSLPTGESRYADAVLLVLYGYRRLREIDEVLVTNLKASLDASGSSPARIDRIAEPSIREGLLLKGGKAKGGRYRLTTQGVARAENLVRTLLSKLT